MRRHLKKKGLGVNLDYVYANIDDKYEMLTEEERQQYGNVEKLFENDCKIVCMNKEFLVFCAKNDWVAIQVYNCCKGT